jgi:hypothetical protein
MNRGQESTPEQSCRSTSSHDQAWRDVPTAGGRQLSSFENESIFYPHSTFQCYEDDMPEQKVNSVTASNQSCSTRKPMVPMLNGCESHEDFHLLDIERSGDRQYLLLPRPMLQNRRSLKWATEITSYASFSGESGFSSTTSSIAMSNSTTRSSGTVDATEVPSPTSARLDDITSASEIGLSNLDRTHLELPVLDYLTPETIAITSPRAYPKLKLLQRKEEQSNPFSADGITNTGCNELNKPPPVSLPPRSARFIANERQPWNAPSPHPWTTRDSMNSPKPEACEPMLNIWQEVDERSYYTPENPTTRN